MKSEYTSPRRLIPVMALLLACFSCSAQKEVLPEPPLVEQAPVLPSPTPAPKPMVPERPVVSKPEPVPTPPKLKTSLRCQDDTRLVFNSCGIDALPFVRTAFFDIDQDGTQEMIAGTKGGSLNLYKNHGQAENPSWELIPDFFDGIQAGAFSSPAVGDIDNDGRAEIALGTGGFSSDSGRVVIFKNFGMPSRPLWRKIRLPEISVGTDATPALFDIDRDGRPDLIVGNAAGSLYLFRNRTENNRILFEKDPEYFRGIQLGLYLVPAVTSSGGRTIIIAGDDKGRLNILARPQTKKSAWSRESLNISLNSFAAPAFFTAGDSDKKDLVISDGNGQLYYFKNKRGNYREWEESPAFFSGRISPGPACSPSVAEIDSRPYMVVGNINGEIKLFEYLPSSGRLPWKEKPGFFRHVKLPGFSRGVLADWQDRNLLITGEQDGMIRAFLNTGTLEKPSWVEQKSFFGTIPGMLHAAPVVFDMNGDGRWELLVGDADGQVRGFRYEIGPDGMPVWHGLDEVFTQVKVDRYAAPAVFRDADRLYLLAGQQDGKITMFTADARVPGFPIFSRDEYLRGIRMENHSSPSVVLKGGLIDLSIGDYNGNLRHFACEKKEVPVEEN